MDHSLLEYAPVESVNLNSKCVYNNSKYLEDITTIISTDHTIQDLHSILSKLATYIPNYHKNNVNSTTLWKIFDALQRACKNINNRLIIVNDSNFVPILCDFLHDDLDDEKKITILRLLRQLSTGTEIMCPIPNIRQLLEILVNWIEAKNEKIIELSLNVLVNLCYKDMTATNTLLAFINVQQLIKICCAIKVSTPLMDIQIKKLFVILEFTGIIPDEFLKEIIQNTFMAISMLLKNGDSELLQQTVEFFQDVACKSNINDFHDYKKLFEHLFQVIVNIPHSMETNEDLPNEENKYELLESICAFMNIFFTHNVKEMDNISSNLVNLLSELMKLIEYKCNNLNVSITAFGCLQLLINLIANAKTRTETVKRLNTLGVETFLQLISPFYSYNSSTQKVKVALNMNTTSENMNTFVAVISVIRVLSQYDNQWSFVINDLIKCRFSYSILAESLFNSPSEIRGLVFHVFPPFSTNLMGLALERFLKKLWIRNEQSPTTNINISLLSKTQRHALNELCTRLQTAFENESLTSQSSIVDVVQCYEQQIKDLLASEKLAQVQAKSHMDHYNALKFRNAQLTNQLSRCHQRIVYNDYLRKYQENEQSDLKCHLNLYKSKNLEMQNTIQMQADQIKDLESRLEKSNAKNRKLTEDLEKCELQLTKKTKNMETICKLALGKE